MVSGTSYARSLLLCYCHAAAVCSAQVLHPHPHSLPLNADFLYQLSGGRQRAGYPRRGGKGSACYPFQAQACSSDRSASPEQQQHLCHDSSLHCAATRPRR